MFCWQIHNVMRRACQFSNKQSIDAVKSIVSCTDCGWSEQIYPPFSLPPDSDNVTRPLIRIFPPHSTQANFCYRNAFIINTKQASKFQSDLYCFIFHNRCLKNKMMLSSFKELKQITNLYNKPISKILHIKTLQHLCKLRYK